MLRSLTNGNERVNVLLKTCRDLFVHCYFVYEFGLVAVIWSVLAVEVALRDCLDEEARQDDGPIGAWSATLRF